MFSIIYCPFLLGCRWSWLTWALGFMFLWLVKSTLWFLHCTFKHSVRSLAFLENLYPRGIILEAAICWPFSFTDKANEINSLVISSDEQTDLRSLVPVSRITRSGFVYVRADIMFHGFSGNSQKWLQKNSVIIVSFVCNRFYRWISKTHVSRVIWSYEWKTSAVNQHLAMLDGCFGLVQVQMSYTMWPHEEKWLNDQVTLLVGAPHGMSPKYRV